MARDLDLDLRSGYTAYRRASVIDLYLYAEFHGDGKKKISNVPSKFKVT